MFPKKTYAGLIHTGMVKICSLFKFHTRPKNKLAFLFWGCQLCLKNVVGKQAVLIQSTLPGGKSPEASVLKPRKRLKALQLSF